MLVVLLFKQKDYEPFIKSAKEVRGLKTDPPSLKLRRAGGGGQRAEKF